MWRKRERKGEEGEGRSGEKEVEETESKGRKRRERERERREERGERERVALYKIFHAWQLHQQIQFSMLFCSFLRIFVTLIRGHEFLTKHYVGGCIIYKCSPLHIS